VRVGLPSIKKEGRTPGPLLLFVLSLVGHYVLATESPIPSSFFALEFSLVCKIQHFMGTHVQNVGDLFGLK
jgi:hypothetical protein